MEAGAADEKSKQLAALSVPPPQQQGRPVPPPSEAPPGHHPPHPPPHHPPHPPPGPYEQNWGRPYHPYEHANPEQRGHAPYSAPPRENPHSHPPDMYQRHSMSGPPRPPPDGSYPPVNGDGHPSPSMPGAPPHGDFRSRLPYPPHEGHPNSEAPPGMPVRHHEGMHTPLAHHQYPPQTPLSHQHSSYEASGHFLSHAGGPFGQRQRKTTRAQQACDQCRARKAKCDEGRPSCAHCKDNNIQCVYKDIPPHKHERVTQMVLDKLQDLADRSDELGLKLDTIIERKEDPTPAREKHDVPTERKESASSSKAASAKQPTGKPTETQSEPSPSQKLPADEVKQEPNEAADDEELSIPIEHTTAAHKLLWWPSIQKLLPQKIEEDYVMLLEESRGPIRPYGRGEGIEHDVFYGINDNQVTSSSPQEEGNHAGSSPATRFGTGLEFYQGGQRQQPPPVSSADPPTEVRNPSRTLNLDADTIRMHHDSYLQNMHVLHPFLGLATLDSMVAKFIRNHSPPKRTFSSQFVQVQPGDPPATLHRVPKRKRSADAHSKYSATSESAPSERGGGTGLNFTPVHRSMENAVVLLVLALGAICSWKGEIPGPIPDPHPKSSPFGPQAGVSPVPPGSTLQSSSPFQSPSDSFGSHHSRRQSSSSQPAGSDPNNDANDPNRRNMDVIPGMAYYAVASDILGNLQGGNDLLHAQACLLAALYTGQLAHPFDSHGWISQAARACQVLVRPQRFHRMEEGPMKELICFVFWTCLQLESDILAELDLPASGISRLEGRMDFPRGTAAHSVPNEIDSPATMMMIYYMAQIHLRKALNRVHTDLYKAERQKSGNWSISVQEALSLNLEQWRASQPELMRWNDNDPPSSNINIARLRAKYYGARYIIHRPLLHHALHPIAPKPLQGQVAAESPALSAVSSSQSQSSPAFPYNQHAETMERGTSEMGPPPRIYSSQNPQPSSLNDLDPKVHAACVTCIEAAMNSTTAFDGIEGRPIVTNIFGTAHAQFGNMLVLSATYTSKLSSLVDGDKLRHLLDRTINFLWQSRYISPTLRKDAEILGLIRSKLFDQQQSQPSS